MTIFEKYEYIVYIMKVLSGFETYRHANGYGARIKPFSLNCNGYSLGYRKDLLMISDDRRRSYTIKNGLQTDRIRTDIACNFYNPKFKTLKTNYEDDMFFVGGYKREHEQVELHKLLEEDVNFQMSLIEDIPSTDEVQEIINVMKLLQANDIGYNGKYDVPIELPLAEFLAYMEAETPYVANYWKGINNEV